MLGSIGLLDFLSWWLLGLSPEAAILLRAVLAPTDPVLASEVQSLPPLTNETNEVRFALTSEAGFNDGLAFPFTNLSLAVAAASPAYGGGSIIGCGSILSTKSGGAKAGKEGR
jgi:sodium/hydrogen antiporter